MRNRKADPARSELFKGTHKRKLTYHALTPRGLEYLHSWPTGFLYMTFESAQDAQVYAEAIGAEVRHASTHKPGCTTLADGIEAHCDCKEEA